MKRSELIKGCFLGLMVVGLVLFGSLPAIAQGNSDDSHFIGPAVQRPLSDFLDVQGTYCLPDGQGGCLILNSPLPNYFLLTDEDRNRKAAIDYAGLAAEYALSQGLDFGTQVNGTVTERPVSDGRALVRVNLVTTNAFTWVVSGFNTATSPVIFGNRIAEVLAGVAPALGDCTLSIEFLNFFPGAPLPDLLLVLVPPENGFPVALRRLTFTASALGEVHIDGVPDGTLGVATVTHLNLQMNKAGPTFPLEIGGSSSNILVRPFGR